MHDDQLDAAIDEAARLMTEGAPRAGFRARVVERIAVRRSWSGVRRWFVVRAPALEAAALLIGIILIAVRYHPARDRPPTSPGPQAQQAGVRRDEPASTPSSAPARSVRLKPDTTAKSESDSVVAIDSVVEQPIPIESIAVVALPDDSLGIEPLPPVPPIAVEPLGIEIEGDRR
jgi:hypothetical protein